MEKWFSIAELLTLKNEVKLPSTPQGLLIKAKRENWLSRPRFGRGGGLEYHISSLPKETQQALAAREVNQMVKELEAEPSAIAGKEEAAKLKIREEISDSIRMRNRLNGLVKAEGLKDMAKERMNAKVEILAMWEQYLACSQECKTNAMFAFVSEYNSGKIQPNAEVRAILATISQPSLLKWIKKAKNEGIASLAGNYGNRKGSSIIDSTKELKNFILALVMEKPHVSGMHIYEALQARFEGVYRIPDRRTVERWFNSWKSENEELFVAINQPDKWKNIYMLAVGSTTENILRYNQQWQMDSTPTDIMLSDGRHTILGVIEVWSRRVKFLVCKSGKATAVAALIRRALIDWGVPEEIKMDNGSDYKSKHVAQVLNALEVAQKFCTPFSPWEKPQIERVFETFSHGLLELCPQFIGHNVAERKSIEERKSFAQRLMNKDNRGNRRTTEAEPINGEFISSLELQEICDKWTNGLYWMSCHSELKMSPCQKVNSWTGSVRRISDDNIRGLDILLSPVAGNDGRRVVSKKGISVNNWDYWADELIAFINKTVICREDKTDYGRITVFTVEKEFICVAVCPEIIGISRAKLGVHVRTVQKKRIIEKKKELKAITSSVSVNGIEHEILDRYTKMADEAQKPHETVEEYSTRKLESAAEAVIAIEELSKEPTFESINESAGTVSEETESKLAEVIQLEERRESAEERENREKGERMSRYEALEAVNFEGISPEDEAWRRSWERTPEYAAWKCLGNIFKSNSK